MYSIPVNLPPELEARPRRVVRNRWGDGCGLWFIRAFIFPHTLVGIGMLGWLLVVIAWAIAGANQTAAVTGLSTSTSSKGTTTYRAAYQFTVHNSPRRGESTITSNEHSRLGALPDAQRTITVRVLAVGPWHYAEVSNSAGDVASKLGMIAFFALFWNGILSLFVWMAWIEPWRRRQLYRWGLPAPGVVTGTRVTRGKSTTYYIEYRFITPDGGEHSGKHNISKADYDRAQAGQSVTVLHHEGKSKPSVVYEYGGYRAQSGGAG